MRERGESRNALSIRAGLSKGAVSDYLAHPERTPRPRAIRRLAMALDVDEDYLTGKSDLRRRAVAKPVATDEDAAGVQDRLAACLMACVDGSDDTLRAFTGVRDGEAFGITRAALVIASASGEPRTGQLVVTPDKDGQPVIRFLAEPYLVAVAPDGTPSATAQTPRTGLIWCILGVWRPA